MDFSVEFGILGFLNRCLIHSGGCLGVVVEVYEELSQSVDGVVVEAVFQR